MADRPNNEARTTDLSIVIVNWNTCAELSACLRSIETNPPACEYEITVVDNASADGSVEMVRSEFRRVQLIQNTANVGFSKGCNQGMAQSRGRYVLLLNPDSEVQPGALSALVRFGDEHPEFGIIGPKILNPNGTLQYSCRRFPTLAAGVFRNTILGKYFPRNTYLMDYLMADWDHSEVREVDWVSGAVLMVRREVLDNVGALDERFYMYVEDVDLAYRARQKGYRVAYFPDAAVVHACGKSSDKNPNRMIIEFHKSMFRFFRKHYARTASIPVKILVPIGLIARATFYIARNSFYHYGHAIAVRMGRARPAEQSSEGQCGEE